MSKKITFALRFVFAIFLIIGGVFFFIKNLKLIEILKEKPFDVVVANVTLDSAEVFWKVEKSDLQMLAYREKDSKEQFMLATGGDFLFPENLTKTNLYISRIQGLTPDKEYEFKIASANSAWFEGFSFKTLKLEESITMPSIDSDYTTFDKLILISAEDGTNRMLNSFDSGTYAFDSQGKDFSKREYAQISFKEKLAKELNSMLVKRTYARQADGSPPNCLVNLTINNKSFLSSGGGFADKQFFINKATVFYFPNGGNSSDICFDDVYCTSLEAGVNPWLPLVMWAQESGCSAYDSGTIGLQDFGINRAEIQFDFKNQLDWFLRIAKFGSSYGCNKNGDIISILQNLGVVEDKVTREQVIPDIANWSGKSQQLLTNALWGNMYIEHSCDASLAEGLRYWTKLNYHYALLTAGRYSPSSLDYSSVGSSNVNGIEKYLNIGKAPNTGSNWGYSLLKNKLPDACDHSKATVNIQYRKGASDKETRNRKKQISIDLVTTTNPENILCDNLAGCFCLYTEYGDTPRARDVRINEYCTEPGESRKYKCWKSGDCDNPKDKVKPCHALDDNGSDWYSSEFVCNGSGGIGTGPGPGPGTEPEPEPGDCTSNPPGETDIAIGQKCNDAGGCECCKNADCTNNPLIKEVPCGEICKEEAKKEINVTEEDQLCENKSGCVCIYPNGTRVEAQYDELCKVDGTVVPNPDKGKTVLKIKDRDIHCNDENGCVCYWDKRTIRKETTDEYVCMVDKTLVLKTEYGKEVLEVKDQDLHCSNRIGCICYWDNKAVKKEAEKDQTCTVNKEVIKTEKICCYNNNRLSVQMPYACEGSIYEQIPTENCRIETKKYNIKQGYSFISPIFLIGEQEYAPKTAHDLINLSDKRIITVGLFEKNQWTKVVEVKEGKIYGTDFPLESGKTYMVVSHHPVEFTAVGASISTVDIKKLVGWNLVPSQTISKDSNYAKEILGNIKYNALHQIAQWSIPKSHFLYTIKDSNNNIFGDDIKITDSEGVFIRIKEK